ncbi:hypothetical protein [Brevundimonas goettingensis]|uniref:Uncharacterized protein n=1 Tax=Brevundimonas goettingensis TaxID=2774190 RepID=A0A975C5I3_9CAUL|nr:hypothetical protein [Brevundimonas goettingensis]QTC92839.1 hypothetical protein IFJ75_08350 [Brevundimonas goettingensis]
MAVLDFNEQLVDRSVGAFDDLGDVTDFRAAGADELGVKELGLGQAQRDDGRPGNHCAGLRLSFHPVLGCVISVATGDQQACKAEDEGKGFHGTSFQTTVLNGVLLPQFPTCDDVRRFPAAEVC